ncbi:hypothetical protein [uncultured Phenylobacterium sp.]|uniref:hypothetical protein n=1 Tax=uncultured Phenylobacterium sp. TaxID=349273 RepID=UPI0025E5D089|nr:hypothetical protein [uncultured Phenylobacterium sp.]
MKIRLLACAAGLSLCAPLGAVAAEMFTFTSTSKQIDRVQLPAPTPSGRPSGAGIFTLDTKTTYADGKVTQIAGKCAQWILPPGQQFGSNSVCTYADATGELYTVRFTCEVPGPGQSCWGKLIGTGGRFKGRTGSFTSGSNGQGGNMGTGFWN